MVSVEETRGCPPPYTDEHISQAGGMSRKTYFRRVKFTHSSVRSEES